MERREIPGEGRTPRYNPKRYEAYCKYCYQTHRLWQRFWDVFPDEVVWECEVCAHRTRDEYMQIEGVQPSAEQMAFYREYGGVYCGGLILPEGRH